MGPRKRPEFLRAGAHEQRQHDVGVQRCALGRPKDLFGLCERERLRRPSSRPVGMSQSATTFRLTLSRAWAFRTARLRIE
jgi:hypothetical protein